MPLHLTEAELGQLIAERKPLVEDYQQRVILKSKRGHRERELDLTGANGSQFRLILRQSDLSPLDFSAILAYLPPTTNQIFRLRRHNGKSHEHTNMIEGNRFYDFHIHIATERYQQFGMEKEDGYAQPTDRFSDFHGALRCLLNDCSFLIPESAQGDLFEGVPSNDH